MDGSSSTTLINAGPDFRALLTRCILAPTHVSLRSFRVSESRYFGLASAGAVPRDSQRIGDSHQIGEGAGVHFAHDVHAVDLRRNFADAQIRRDALISEAAAYEGYDLAFTDGQR